MVENMRIRDSDITSSGRRVGQIEITVGPPYANSSEIPVLLNVNQEPSFRLDEVTIGLSSSIHRPLTCQPDFYLKPTYPSNKYNIECYASPQPYATETMLSAKNLHLASDEGFYQELVFSPTNPDLSIPLEFYFSLSIVMHENSLIQLTSLQLGNSIALNATAL